MLHQPRQSTGNDASDNSDSEIFHRACNSECYNRNESGRRRQISWSVAKIRTGFAQRFRGVYISWCGRLKSNPVFGVCVGIVVRTYSNNHLPPPKNSNLTSWFGQHVRHCHVMLLGKALDEAVSFLLKPLP
jgi:hypothetical protein